MQKPDIPLSKDEIPTCIRRRIVSRDDFDVEPPDEYCADNHGPKDDAERAALRAYNRDRI